MKLSEGRRGNPKLIPSDIPYWSRFHSTPTEADLAEYRHSWHEHAHGWPFVSLVYRQESDIQQRDGTGNVINNPRPSRTSAAIALSPSTPLIRRWEYLPTEIVWKGFLADAALYSLPWFVLLMLPIRRFIRTKRGLCPACAYPRGESDVCSECGKALAGGAERIMQQMSYTGPSNSR